MVGAGLALDVISVCRRPPPWVSEVTADYAARLARHVALCFRYVAPAADSLAAASRKRDEAARTARLIAPGTHVVALDIGGTPLSSPGLAGWLSEWRSEQRAVALIIGGADGLDPAFTRRAAQRWSLSNLTLPHLLVQVVVAEQVYRAWTILAGHPYHRA